MSERKAGRARNRSAEKPEQETSVEEASRGAYRTTLGERGPKLPIGILSKEGATVHTSFDVKPWKTKDERALGDLIAPDANMADHVSAVVANMTTQLGPHDMVNMKPEERDLAVRMMYVADVFYVYAYLRRRAMGNKLRLNITCPRQGCGVEFPYTGMIDTIDVMAVDDIDDILWTYELEEPIEIRKVKVERFQMGYPKWSVMHEAKGTTNQADVKAITIRGSIVGINDEQTPVSLTANEIDELSKIDFEQIQEGINDHYMGPKMGIEGECSPAVCSKYKRGGYKFMYPINWRYQDFFAASSR